MRRVYAKMFLAMIVTALSAYVCANVPAIYTVLFSNKILFYGLLILELVMAFSLVGAVNRMSSSTATFIFYLYSILNGVVLSSIFFVYTLPSIVSTFFITAGVFAAMSIYGYVTKSDLTRFGSFMVMALIGLIICIVVNMFLRSAMMDWIISFAGVAIFIGLTAWDTQKIKQMAMMTDNSNVGKLATIGALSLYLDFVNLFLYLLRFFGSSRN